MRVITLLPLLATLAASACKAPDAAVPIRTAAVDIDLLGETRAVVARVTGGMTFGSLLAAHVSDVEAGNVLASVQGVFDARKLRAGHPIDWCNQLTAR